jgi:hypothetical protein
MSLENCSNEHNIDFIAKSFFIFMISISFVNDIYSIKETIFSNEYIKENINKLSDISDVFKKFLSNKEKKTKDGFIIKNNDIIQKKDLLKNTKNMNNTNNTNNKNNTDNISNEKSLNNVQENILSNLEEIKPLEIISDTSIKKKKKVYNNELMEEVKEIKEVKELKVKKKDNKQLNNKKKEDINKEIVEE